MEVEFLKKRDIDKKIRFTDISAPDYDPSQHGNVQFADGMRKLRAVLPDNTVITGVEVFRQTYEAIGLGWVFQLTSIPLVGKLADGLYDVWAENRLRITGRGELADILKERADKLRDAEPAECDADGCALDYDI
jgi:predicted DCC family thiol-disulfide oxidoreductase YuxK